MDEPKSVELLSYHNTEDELEFIKFRLLELEQEKKRLIQRQEVLNTTQNDHKLITNGTKQLSTDE